MIEQTKIALDLFIASIPVTFLILSGGVMPFIASLLSICWLLTRFLDYIDKTHDKSFKVFFKWLFSWLKKN